MKNIDLESIKKWTGVIMAITTGVVACATAISDKNKTDKMEELIKKVDELTK